MTKLQVTHIYPGFSQPSSGICVSAPVFYLCNGVNNFISGSIVTKVEVQFGIITCKDIVIDPYI